MSYDFDTTLIGCDHMVLRERVNIDPFDLRTLTNSWVPRSTRAPIKSKSSVRVFFSGVEVPPDHPRYGWDVVRDVEDLDGSRLKIVLRKECRWVGPVEINYITNAAFCNKCEGKGALNDLTVSPTGDLTKISDYSKLLQRCLKFILTSECRFYPQFTSSLRKMPGNKIGTLMEEDITQETSRALSNLQAIQTAQKSVQTLSPGEILKSIDSVTTQVSDDDPSKVKVTIQASSYGNSNTVPISVSLRSSR